MLEPIFYCPYFISREKAKLNDQTKYNRLKKEIEMECRRAKNEWWHTNMKKLKPSSRNTGLENAQKNKGGHRTRT